MVRTWIMLVLFVGMFLVMHGVYEERLDAVRKSVRVEYRFIPRTYYEEQLMDAEGSLATKFKNMFNGENPGPGGRFG